MSVGSGIALITAAMDLNLVRSLRQAMSPAAGRPVAGIGPAPTHIEPRPHIHPTPLIEPRPRITPTPRFEPRVVYRPHRIEPQIQTPCPTTPAVVEPERPRIAQSPIQPPWKVLPWQNPPPPAPELKVAYQPPDPDKKGTVLDVFV